MKTNFANAAYALRTHRLLRLTMALTVCHVVMLFCNLAVQAQSIPTNSNYLLSSDLPPGAVAAAQSNRRPPIHGYFQPVQISGPQGLSIALAQDSQFLPLLEAPVRAAFMVGHVYRIKVSGIPQYEGEELFPTIEVIDRLYAPVGREHRFPIPIVLEEDDLRAALRGELVTRVIYLEDSEIAEPVADAPGDQRVTEVSGTENPLQAADQLGRPVAIVRIGSRTPNLGGDLTDFLYGCPPWSTIKPIPERQKLIENGMWPAAPQTDAAPATPPAATSSLPTTPLPATKPGSVSING
jgi:hypothetical protein